MRESETLEEGKEKEKVEEKIKSEKTSHNSAFDWLWFSVVVSACYIENFP